MRGGIVAGIVIASLAVTRAAPAEGARRGPPGNDDVSRRHFNESEEAVAINPTNPSNIVIVTNVDHPDAGLFEGVSFDGGQTWTTKLIGDNDNLGDACCD